MGRPQFLNCPMPNGVISRIREEQASYDRDPQAYERREQQAREDRDRERYEQEQYMQEEY